MARFSIAAVILLLVTNAIVLAAAAYNRSGSPVVSIQLTERELPIPYAYNFADENSGMSLQLRWNVLDPEKEPQFLYRSYNTPAWLDDAALTGLGFDIHELESDKDRYQNRIFGLEREAILVLEYQGDAYQQALASAEARIAGLQSELDADPGNQRLVNQLQSFEQGLTRLRQAQSRLYVIDGSRDKQALLQKYAERDNVLFARGIIGLSWNQDRIEGRIQRLSIEQIHVPLPQSQPLLGLTPQRPRHQAYSPGDQAPRYRVQLNIGKRLEPWVEAVSLIE